MRSSSPPVPGPAATQGPLWPLALAAAALFPLLVGLRRLDDNTLTSWTWALEGRDATGIWALHLLAVTAAVLLSRVSPPAGARTPILVAAALFFSAALREEPEALIDASRYFLQARHLAEQGLAVFWREWGAAIPAWTDLPLPGFLYGLAFRALGEHRLAAQGLAAAMLAATLLATARLGSLLWDEETGFLAALLLLGIPCLLIQVPLLMGDLPAMCLTTVALAALVGAARLGGAVRIAAAAAALGAALLAKYSLWLLLGAGAAAVLGAETARGGVPAARRALLSCAGAAGVLGLFALAKGELVADQIRFLSDYQWSGLRRWGESYVSTFLFQSHPLLACAAAAGLWRAARRREPGALIAGALPLLLIAMQVRRTRYLMPAFPMLALLAARGLESLGGRRRRFAVWSAVGFSFVTLLALFLPFLMRINTANLKAAGEFLDGHGVRRVEAWTIPPPDLPVNPEVAVPILDYHTAAEVALRGDPHPRPSEGVLHTTALRFTWDVPLPADYRRAWGAGPPAAQVLISGDPSAPLPAGLAAAIGDRAPDATFVRDAVFRFHMLVSVWLPAPPRLRP